MLIQHVKRHILSLNYDKLNLSLIQELPMPYLIDTPEGWFRTKQKDLYVLDYRVDGESDCLSDSEMDAINKKYRDDQEILSEWFLVNLPATPLEVLGPSEYSGYILGGPCIIVADFDEPSLAKFCATWEKADSMWRVELKPYAQWLEKVRSCKLLPMPLATQQRVRWWDTPIGVILMSEAHDGISLSRRDAWWLLQQLVPELQSAKLDDYPYGEYFPKDDKSPSYIVIDCGDPCIDTWDSSEYEKDQSKINKLRKALGILKEDSVRVVVSD